ncbi:DUF2891 family protein [Propionibacteriaceae bacterium Y1923]|uniref:DUF2891 family protein n=1 Tax=Aestuariimicrobium sp. Y1814 TaxID=3418742 RepID=UPI003C284130
MDETTAARIGRHGTDWATTVLQALRTDWPWAWSYLALSADDWGRSPQQVHPAFHASLDWHSSVHMQHSAMLLLEAAEDLTTAPHRDLLDELDTRLTGQNIAVEVEHLAAHRSFERPYGWAWACQLAATAQRLAEGSGPLAERAAGWAGAVRPLADLVGDLLVAWLPTLAAPVRHGVHSNTAFALGLLRDAQAHLGRAEVVEAIDSAALGWFGGDVDYPSQWEPSGADFLSPALAEADLMRRVLEPVEFGAWLRTFLPVLGEPGDALLRLPEVLDPTDGHAVHLYGLALSRSAMLRRLAPWVDDPARSAVLESSAEQYGWAGHAITEGDFMSTHWLVTFALL